jgi:hypothetical protein
MTDLTNMNEDEFFAKFDTIESPSGSTIWQREELVVNGQSLYPDNQVWTYVCDEVDGAIAGWHFVNMIGYIVTKQSWVSGDEGMVFDSACCWCSESIREVNDAWLADGKATCAESPKGKHSPYEEDEDEDEEDE